MRMRHNGYEINYDVEGSGPPLVLIHGVGSSLRSWDHVVDRLRDAYRILRYDTLGHGNSEKPDGPYALDDYVSELLALLDAEGIERANIVGSSFGGMIAQAFAIAHPERVATVAFLSAVAARTPEQREAVIERADQLAAGGAERTIGAALERWYTPEFRAEHPDLLAEQAARVTANDPNGYAAAYRVFAESDLDQELSQIRVPTLIVTGEYDVGSTPEMARLMHDRIAGSRLEILPGLRHGILVEAPDAVADLLRDFLSGNEAARPLPVRSRSS
jgi:(E)-2-((N-methylformamido)methylene)succinate hydrolase